MRRPLVVTLIVGIFTVLVVSALQLVPQVAQFEARAADYLSTYTSATRIVPKQWHYVFMSILALGVAALTATSLRRGRIGLLVNGLLRLGEFAIRDLLDLRWKISCDF